MNNIQIESDKRFVINYQELVIQLCEVIGYEDYALALRLNQRIRRMLPSLLTIIKRCKDVTLTNPEAGLILSIIRETRKLQDKSLEKIYIAKETLSNTLKELNNGRKLVRSYHTGRSVHSIFELRG